MFNRNDETGARIGALQSAIFNSANFSSIATDAKGVIQIFNVGAERMLGFAAAEVMNKITPADISDPQELIARAKALSLEFGNRLRKGAGPLFIAVALRFAFLRDLTGGLADTRQLCVYPYGLAYIVPRDMPGA